MNNPAQPVLLFDGQCNLCNGLVRFVIARDLKGVFRFAPLQGPSAAMYLRRFKLEQEALDTVILVEGANAYRKSSAALRTLRRLRFPWPLGYAFMAVPRPVRDLAYDVVAKSRYRIWGRNETCMLPTAELKARFLE